MRIKFSAQRASWIMSALMLPFFMLFFQASFAGVSDVEEQGVLQRKISFQVENMKIKNVLKIIEQHAAARFGYQPQLVDSNRMVSLMVEDTPVISVLNMLFDSSIKFDEVGSMIIFKPAATNVEIFATISGKVTDAETGEALPGVNVLVKGTANGTSTDIEGKYTLQAENSEAVLVFTFVGYESQEVPLNSRVIIDVQLAAEKKQLQEVVVVGYGTQRKIDVTGAVVSVKAEDMLTKPVTNALEGLQGRVAGVDVSLNSGAPGGLPTVVIRGVGSLNSSTNPLYIVDGVAMSDIRFLNPYDIQNVEVLKDASSASIYGARGSNGVILITTKRGGVGQRANVTYDGSFSVGELPRELPVLNSREFLDVLRGGMANNPIWGVAPKTLITTNPLIFNADGSPKYNTNWQRETTRTAISNNHEIGIQTKGENSSTGIFLNYSYNQGIMINSDLRRYYLKLANDTKISKWLDFGINALVNSSGENFVPPCTGGNSPTRTMIEYPSIFPVKYPDGTWAHNQQASDLSFLDTAENPVKALQQQTNLINRTEIFGNTFLNFKIAKGLEFKTQFGMDYLNSTTRYYSPSTLINSATQRGVASINNSQTFYWQQENFLSFKRQFGLHSINAVGGASWQANTVRTLGASTQYFVDDYYRENNLGAGAQPNTPSSNYTYWSINSYFLRAGYTYADKYMLTLSGRIDGSSRFGKSNKYGAFPAIGVGYVLSKENFMKDFSTIDYLKLRASYGETGNTEIGSYQSLATMQSGTTLLNGQRVNTAYVGRLPNPDLKWEKSKQFDIGFELEMYNSRITLEMDYYHKLTSDLLLNKPIPTSTGYQSVLTNIGSVSNRGADIGLQTWNVKTGHFDWKTSFIANYNKNRVEKLGSNDEDIFPGPYWNPVPNGFTILRVGEPVGSFWGYERLGTWSTADVAAAKAADPNFSKRPGEEKESNDKKIVGKGQPDWSGSFINNFRYKNFDFMMDLQFSQGASVVQAFLFSSEDRTGYSNSLKTVLNSWTPQNQNTPIQQLRFAPSAGQAAIFDTHWVGDGSFMRGRNLALGYTLGNSALERLKIKRLRFYISAQNLFLIKAKSYLGYDPQNITFNFDTQGQGAPPYGQNIEFYQYPKARTFTMGVNVNF